MKNNRLYKLLFCSIVVLAMSITSIGQTNIASYSFSKSMSVYTELPTPAILGAATTTSGSASLDDVNYRVDFPGDFSFQYGGISQSAVNVNTNGYVGFSTTSWTTSSVYTPLSSAVTGGVVGGVIAGFATDMNAFSNVSSNSGTIGWQILGSGNDEILAIQFQNFKPYVPSDAVSRRINFQILFYESTHALQPNQIEVIYGDCIVGDSPSLTVQVGLRGNSTAFVSNVNSLKLLNLPAGTDCSWEQAVLGNANNSGLFYSEVNPNIAIPNGLVFRWSPQFVVSPVRSFSAVTGVSSSGATISWTAPIGATQYNVQYRVFGDCDWTDWSGNPANSASATLTGLDANTKYQVRVQAFSGDNFAPYSHIPASNGTGDGYGGEKTFLTSCAEITSLPWSEDWESVAVTGTSQFVDCWLEAGSGGFASSSGQSPITARSGDKFLLVDWSETNSYMWSPPFFLEGGITYAFSSYYVTDGLAGWSNLGMFVNSSQDGNTSQQLGSLVLNATNTEYVNMSRDFTPVESGTYYFAVRVNSTVNPNYMGWDDFELKRFCDGQPTISPGASVSSDFLCTGGVVELSLGDNLEQEAGFDVQWKKSSTGDSGTYTDIDGANTTNAYLDVTGDVWVKAFVTCSTSGLSDSTQVFEINAPMYPVPIISSDFSQFCGVGETAHLSVSADADPGYLYAWSVIKNGNISSLNGNEIDFEVTANPGSYATVKVVGSFDVCDIEKVYSIPVYDNVAFPISTSPNDTLCAAGSVQLVADISDADPKTTCIEAPLELSVPPVDAIVLCEGGNAWVPISFGSLDDGTWNNRSIGFTFNYFGIEYSSLSVGSNGVVRMGATGTVQYNFSEGFPSSSGTFNDIAICARDLQLDAGEGFYNFGGGSIRYWTEGYAPHRVFVLQYDHCATWYSTDENDGYNSAELLLYETTGAIEIRVIAATNPSATTGTFINETRNKYIGLQYNNGLDGLSALNCWDNTPNYWNGNSNAIVTSLAWRFSPHYAHNLVWSPALALEGSNEGVDLFSVNSVVLTESTNFSVTSTDEITGCSTTSSLDVVVLDACIYGCTDSEACNYDSNATIGDGSCNYACQGCTDITACNYDVSYTMDDGSCLYGTDCTGCTDPEADNYGPQFIFDDNSCTYHGEILIFNDSDGNGVKGPGEAGLENWAVYVPQIAATVFSNSAGIVFLNVPSGNFNVELIIANSEWVNTTPTSGIVAVPGTLHFGVTANGGVSFIVNNNLEDIILHCTNGYSAGAIVNNNGAVPLHGSLTMECDLLFTPEPISGTSFVAPSVMSPGFAQWDISSAAGVSSKYKMHVDGPGVELVGEQFDFQFHLILYDPNNVVVYDQSWTRHKINSCSYDPNDISADPEGYSDEHFILPGQRLTYMIRFQNTGNFPAEDILIIDHLDNSVFDLQSFQPVASSSSVTSCLHDDGIADFIMNDINLPDSVHNEPGSHGFIMYEISARVDLTPGSVLYNQANIFFEQNPAVITNQVFHTTFDCSSFSGFESGAPLCAGNALIIDATQENTESYHWLIDNQQMPEGEVLNLGTLAPGSYSITLTTANPLCSESNTGDIVILESPAISAGEDISVCQGEEISVSAISDELSYFWSEGVVDGVPFTANASMTLVATATSENQCSASDSLEITVNALPSSFITQNGSQLIAPDGADWVWYLNEEEIPNQSAQILDLNEPGIYAVFTTSNEGCSSLSASIIVTSIGFDAKESIRVYPNPMLSSALLMLPPGTYSVSITDVTGRVVRTYDNAINSLIVEKENLASGKYALRANNAKSMYTTTLIIN